MGELAMKYNCFQKEPWEQLSLFPREISGTLAISLFDGDEYGAKEPTVQMKKLVPDGEYFVMVGVHPLVLRATKLKCEEVPDGHQFYHFQIGDTVYAGIFVGEEAT